MSSQAECVRCAELWRAYGVATNEHVRLLNEQARVAGVNTDRFRELDSLCEPAAGRRDAARAAIETHLAAEHAEPAQRTMTA